MRWFKHYSDASENRKLKKMSHKLQGDALLGYAVYFKTLELIAKEIEPDNDNLGYIPHDIDIEYLAIEWGIDEDKLKRIYDVLAEVNLIDSAEWQNGRIYCPQILEYCDEYTRKKIQKMSGHCQEFVLTMSGESLKMSSQNRIEKNRIEENINNNTHSSIEHAKSIDFIIVKDDILKLLHDLGFPRKSFRSKTDQEALKEIYMKCDDSWLKVKDGFEHIVKHKDRIKLFSNGFPGLWAIAKNWDWLVNIEDPVEVDFEKIKTIESFVRFLVKNKIPRPQWFSLVKQWRKYWGWKETSEQLMDMIEKEIKKGGNNV